MKNLIKLSITFLLLYPILACTKQIPTITSIDAVALDSTVIGRHIKWDTTTLKKVSYLTGTYGRIVQLPDESLLAVYETGGAIVCVKSTNLGISWSSPVTIAPRHVGTNMTAPDVLLLQDSSLLVCYNPRPYDISPTRKFGIRTKKSYDGGVTWIDERLLYEAGYETINGCWEPSAIQLSSGEIQVYFSNEGIYTSSSEQNISLLSSNDLGLTWTTTPKIVSFRAGKRDGMPVPLLLSDDSTIVLSIEDNGNTTFKPYTVRNTILENWNTTVGALSSYRNYALLDTLNNSVYAGAPYLRRLKTGETILSYQGGEDRGNASTYVDMKVVIGDSTAKNFTKKSVPFKIPLNKSCKWNSLCVLKDSTVIAITSTNGYSSGSTEVWMIKGNVIPD